MEEQPRTNFTASQLSANRLKDSLELVLGLLQARLGNLSKIPNASLRAVFKEALDLAARHQVTPALCGGLRRVANERPTWSDLCPFAQLIEAQNLARNKLLQRVATEIAVRLNSTGINCVFLKGAAILIESEDHAPWRLVTDLDILVAPDAAHRAVSLLLQQGYHQQSDYAGFREGIHHHYPALYNKRSNTFVELHVRLMQDQRENPLETVDIFAQAIPLQKEGQVFLIPCPDHRMIHLIAHAQISNWGYVLRQIILKDIVEAAELEARHKINWSVVRKAFVDIRAENQLMGFVCAAHHLIGLRLPLSESKVGGAKAWANEAVSALHVPHEGWRTSARVIAHYLRLFTRDPVRLKIVWKTLTSRARLKHLLSVNRGRLRNPARGKDRQTDAR